MLSVACTPTRADPAPVMAEGMVAAPPEAGSVAPAPESPVPAAAPVVSCTPAPKVVGAELTARWPALLGRRVRLAARMDRALDFTDAVLTADGASVVVTMSPDAAWSGTQLHTFEVIGSQSVALHGRAVLPHLALADEYSCP